jgi:hypothetical protein
MRIPTVKKSVAYFIVIVFLLSLPVRAGAWGREGHRIVARIAARHLTAKTQTAILKLIQADKEDIDKCKNETSLEEKLACVATWADEVRTSPKYKSTAPLHFVNIPIYVPEAQRHYDQQRDCSKGCVVSAIDKYKQILLTSNNNADRAVALKFIVHFIGDLHQPLHNAMDKDLDFTNVENSTNHHVKLVDKGEGDRGGNLKLVTWLNETSNKFGCWNLHAVWDEGIIEKENADDRAYAETLDQGIKVTTIPAMQSGNTISWVNEAFALAVLNAYGKLPQPVATDKVCEVKAAVGDKKDCDQYTAQLCQKNEVHYRYHLDESYDKQNLPVIKFQLQRAGVRLAKFLNTIFDPTGTP